MIDYSIICTKYIEKILQAYNYLPKKGEDIEHTLLENLIGTSGTFRLGPKPSEETKREILKRIHEKVQKNQRLEVSSAWGAIKTIPSPNRGVDLVELLALKQYEAIAQIIKDLYPPGIRFNIFLGDSYYIYLYGSDPRIDTYCHDMENLSKGHDEINVVRLSNLCKNATFLEQQCEQNYKFLYRYWIETADLPLELHEKTLSFHELRSIGWVGKITPAMRTFYLKRMSSLYPQESYSFWVEKIIRFFAYGLVISQNDFMGRKKAETSTIDACLLRVPPPDLPRELHSNRLRFRIAPECIMKSSAPPWTVAGIIKMNDIVPKIHLLNGTDYKKESLIKLQYGNITFGLSI